MPSESSLSIEFDRLYDSQILPNIEEVETYRLKKKRLSDILGWINLICILASVVVFILACMQKLPPKFLFYGLGGFFSAMIIFVPILNKISDDLRAMLKEAYLTSILDIFGLKRSEVEEISLEAIKDFGLFPKATSNADDDNIVGTYDGIPLVLTETELTHSTGGKNSRTIIDFSGLIIKMSINRNYSGILVGNKKGNTDIMGNLMQIFGGAASDIPQNAQPFAQMAKFAVSQCNEYYSDLSNKFRLKNGALVLRIPSVVKASAITTTLENVKFDNEELNQNYNVYSDNVHEAKSIIPSYLANKLNSLENDFIFSNISFLVNGSEIYLFIENVAVKDNISKQFPNGFFEVGDINTSLLDKNLYFKVFNELSKILLFISSFKADENTDL